MNLRSISRGDKKGMLYSHYSANSTTDILRSSVKGQNIYIVKGAVGEQTHFPIAQGGRNPD